MSTLLYHPQFTEALPAEHAADLLKWSAAIVDRGLGPDDNLRRAPGIPTECMDHPKLTTTSAAVLLAYLGR